MLVLFPLIWTYGYKKQLMFEHLQPQKIKNLHEHPSFKPVRSDFLLSVSYEFLLIITTTIVSYEFLLIITTTTNTDPPSNSVVRFIVLSSYSPNLRVIYLSCRMVMVKIIPSTYDNLYLALTLA
jgi:hypothetical protein